MSETVLHIIKRTTFVLTGFFIWLSVCSNAFAQHTIKGHVELKDNIIADSIVVQVHIDQLNRIVNADPAGNFVIENVPDGNYKLSFFCPGYYTHSKHVQVKGADQEIQLELKPDHKQLAEVSITEKKDDFVDIAHLNAVEGTAIYEGKKTEVITMDKLAANVAVNNARQVFAKIPGLIVWESDGGGLQLGVATRGLSPNRTANFNTRQNGYDISADALGYPESYYTPPMEAIERIEVVRGAASLQYGTQFGGMLNFVFRKGPADKKFELTSRQTGGSFGLFNSFNSVGGQVGKLNYYGCYNYRTSTGWRPNSGFTMNMGYGSVNYQFTPKLNIGLEMTSMEYLAQQPGGLTDAQFNNDPTISTRARNWFKVGWNLPALILDYKFNDRTKLNLRTFALISTRKSVGNIDQTDRPDLGAERTLFDDEYRNLGAELRLLHRYNFFGIKSTGLIGGRSYWGNTYSKQGLGSTGSDANFTYNNSDSLENYDYHYRNTNYSLFAENIFNISKRFTVTPGVRFEYIDTRADGYYAQIVRNPLGPDDYTKNYENASKPRSFLFGGLGLSYKLNEDNEIYGNFSQNYRSVTYSDIRVVNVNAKVDPNIHDEHGYNLDLGLRGIFKEVLYYDASFFYMAYKGRIGETLLQPGPPLYIAQRYRTNIGDSRSIGIESLLELQVIKLFDKSAKTKLSVFTNFSLTDARYLNSQIEGVNGKKVEFVAPLILRSGVTLGRGGFTATLQYSYVAEQYSDATNATYSANAIIGLIPAYSVMDFNVKYNWKWLITAAGVNNITNTKYFTRRATSYPGPGIIPSDPVNFYVTLGVKIGK